MPIYAVKCPKCGLAWEAFHKMSEPHPDCGVCGVRVVTDFTRQKPGRERHFHGTERLSLQFGFDESEVAEARRMFDGTGATIDDAGDVYFDTRSQERAFRRRYAATLQKAEAERAGSTGNHEREAAG